MTGEAIAGDFLLTGAALVVIAALLVSGLRIALPHDAASGNPQQNRIRDWHAGEASQLSASWQNFGPTLEAHDIRAELKMAANFRLNALLWRWMSGRACYICAGSFATTFWQLRFRTNTPITSGGGNDSPEASHISDPVSSSI